MADTYTVKKGDTLSGIAERYKSAYGYSSTYAYVNKLVEINGIVNPDRIVVGQVIKLNGEADTTISPSASRPKITVFGLQSNTDRTMYVTWAWTRTNTKEYRVVWHYATGDGIWFNGNDSTVTSKQSIYSAPSNATRVKVKILPVAKTRKVNNKDVEYWIASWSTERAYSFSSNPPTAPSTPTVSIKEFKLTAEVTNLDVNATHIEFQIVKNDSSVFNRGQAKIKTTKASYSCTVSAGAKYKVRCRSVRGKLYSDWTEYSSNVGTIPATPSGFTVCKASSETSVHLEWKSVANTTSYDIEYTTKQSYFDGSDQTTTVSSIQYTHYEKTGLTSGEEYFFRVRAVNEQGSSGWSKIKSVVVGKLPAAPTTWSSTTTAIVSEGVTLYWVHNSEDGSSQTMAELEVQANGITKSYAIKNTASDDEKDKISSYHFDTSSYKEGVTIQWRVRTAGITGKYGEWSIQRSVDIYAPPTLELIVTDSDGTPFNDLTTFPFYISAEAGPNTQTPIGYHLTISANEGYTTTDNAGNNKIVSAGDEVYSKYFDLSAHLTVEMSAGNLSLENNIEYTITCLVSMNSGLTATASFIFTVAWTDEEFEPNAEVGINDDNFTAFIKPFCKDVDDNLIDGVVLSVYRREFDGSFTELAKDLNNTDNEFIVDPHPALDYARYRIVAKTIATGTVSYCDLPGYPVNGKSVVIQWDEQWSDFDTSEESEMEQPPWEGSLLKLPYNIDVSDSHKPDVALIEYIGREHPVSYYGTQLGTTSTWNVSIAKSDKETLYALRRLAIWMGDVYVREPSGSGYWANVVVAFSQKHLDLTIPVTLTVTRVSGGA